MKSILIKNKLHTRWKVFCSGKEIMMVDATELALELAMKSKKIK